MKSASIKDIADSLKVSKTLVSLVLNKKGTQYGISIATQKKVLEKAKALNYKPNRMAQGLRLGQSKSIGLIIPDISNPFYSKISRFIGDYVDQEGYNLMIYNTDEDEKKEKNIIQNLLESHVDGIILTSTSMQLNDIEQLNHNNIPHVLVDRRLEDIETNYVGIDNYKGAVEAIEYLIQNGAKRIANISVGPAFVSSLEDRKKAYKDTLKKHQIPYHANLDLMVSYNDIETELESQLKVLFESSDKSDRPDALFIANNKLAIEALKTLKSLNISIPEDITVVCFDNIPLFDILPFPISAMAQPIPDICLNATQMLFKEIHNKKASTPLKKQQIILSADLIVR